MAFFAAIDGYLRGDASVDGGCVWLEDPSTGDRVAVVWPPGFAARFDPVELLGPDGAVVARDGDHVGLGGGFLSHEGARCDLGMDRYWLASNVGVAER